MHCIKLFRLMLGNLQHLHGKYAEAVLLKLLDDVADAILANRIGFHDGKGALQSLHSVFVLRPSSFVFSLQADYAKQILSPRNLPFDRRKKRLLPKGRGARTPLPNAFIEQAMDESRRPGGRGALTRGHILGATNAVPIFYFLAGR